MSNVTIDSNGYTITQNAIDGVVNPFLDLDKALNEKFFFLEGQYDQIILEKIFIILNSLSASTKNAVEQAEKTLEEAKKEYEEALSKYTELSNIGAYDVGISDGTSNAVSALISALGTYSVPGVFPSKDGTSCQSAIDNAYNDILSIVCDLFEEVINGITLPNLAFAGDANLSTLKGSLDGVINTLGTTLSATYAEEFNVDTQLINLSSALTAAVGSLEDGTNKTNINAAIDAINAYNATKNAANLAAVETALNTIKGYTEISTISSSVADVLSAVTKKLSYDAAIAAITTYNTTKNDANLEAVKTALNTISGFIELSGISSSIANVLSIIEAVAAINAYGANKSDANLAMVKTELNAISGLSETSVFSITAIIGEIDTYSNVKGEIESARTAIATFKSTKNKTNLEAVVSKLQDVKSVLTGSYDIQSLKAAIDGAITETSGIRTRLNDLTAAIASYNGLTSLTAAPAAFQEVKRAFQAFSDRDIQTKFNNSTISNLSDRVNGCIQKIDAIATFDDFYGDLSNLLAICQNGEIKALLSPADQNLYYGSGTSLKEPLTYADLSSLCNILSGHLNTISTNLNAKKSVFDSAVEALNKQLSGVDPNANINDLLNLCMMASTPKPLDNGYYRLVTGIQRTVDSNGNYTYALIYGGTTIDKAAYEASFSKEDAYKQYSLPYLALAIMYEKVGIQQMVLVEQLKQVEKINEAISENNKLLKALSWLYEKAYGQCINPDAREWYMIYDSELKGSTGFTFLQLNGRLGQTNLNNIYCMYDNRFQMAVNSYDRNGDPVGSGSGSSSSGDSKDDSSSSTPSASEVQNIDVKEQATLTMLSNKQDSVRINGDQLSTNSQLMTTKMSQYMQNSNACVSAATQVVKSIGDYLKTMTSNVR